MSIEGKKSRQRTKREAREALKATKNAINNPPVEITIEEQIKNLSGGMMQEVQRLQAQVNSLISTVNGQDAVIQNLSNEMKQMYDLVNMHAELIGNVLTAMDLDDGNVEDLEEDVNKNLNVKAKDE